jgi:hypothetical protein
LSAVNWNVSLESPVSDAMRGTTSFRRAESVHLAGGDQTVVSLDPENRRAKGAAAPGRSAAIATSPRAATADWPTSIRARSAAGGESTSITSADPMNCDPRNRSAKCPFRKTIIERSDLRDEIALLSL